MERFFCLNFWVVSATFLVSENLGTFGHMNLIKFFSDYGYDLGFSYIKTQYDIQSFYHMAHALFHVSSKAMLDWMHQVG